MEKAASHKHDARIAELDAQIEQHEQALETLHDEASRLKDERAADLAPFKRGERVLYRGKEYEVSRVLALYSRFEVRAWNVLKNGNAGNQEKTLHFTEHIQKIEK